MLFFIRETCFVPDIFKFIYFHFLGQVVVIGEEVNGEIFLKFKRTSIVSKNESIYSLRNSLVHCINKQIYKYFGLNERSDNQFQAFFVFLTPIKIDQIKFSFSDCFFVALYSNPRKNYNPFKIYKNKRKFVQKLKLYFLKYLKNYTFIYNLILQLTLEEQCKVKSVIFETNKRQFPIN